MPTPAGMLFIQHRRPIMMNLESIITRLERNAETIRTMVEDIPQARAARRPAPERWSILEVINHLYDEEREDFRMRTDCTLRDPGAPWPPTDPEGWVSSRNYGSRDMMESLRNFLDERKRSLEWLRGLDSPDWNSASPYNHPVGGPITAGDVLVSWAAHDYLHIRQLTRLLYDELKEDVAPYSVEYAGGWR
jgi:hypothetical protein